MQWWLQAATVRGQGYIAIGVTKAFFGSAAPHGLYREDALMPERFPPLKERLRNFPRGALISELARGRNNSRRDALLFGELASRGSLGNAEVRTLLFDNLPQGPLSPPRWMSIHSRVNALLDGARARGALSAVAPAIESLCLTLGASDPLDEMAVSSVFRAMARSQIDFTRAALQFLERDRFHSSSLHYLQYNGRDPAALSRLAIMRVPPKFENSRRLAVEAMERRIHGAAAK